MKEEVNAARAAVSSAAVSSAAVSSAAVSSSDEPAGGAALGADLAGAWERAVEQTRRLSPGTFAQWFCGVQLDGIDAECVRLAARDEFVRDWVRAHFQTTLLEQLGGALGVQRAWRVEWAVRSRLERPVTDAEAESEQVVRRGVAREPEDGDGASRHSTLRPRGRGVGPLAEARPGDGLAGDVSSAAPEAVGSPPSTRGLRVAVGDALNPKHTFANFVVGPSNELAYAAAVGSADRGGPRYNPLFLCGGTGLGKTHLMHAIAYRVLETRPQARVLYVSTERFTNEFIDALQKGRMADFRSRYRRTCDVLLVDDIQFLAGREQTQEEFFHTFNTLRDAGKPIVVSSDKYPHELQRIPERLISRFGSGLVADVHVPQLETRVAIVRSKAALEGIEVSDEVAVLLAQRIRNNVRELEGTLIRLAAKSSLTGRQIDYAFAASELVALAPAAVELASVEDIQRAVCTHFRLTNAELVSKDRHKSVAFARQVCMYLCRQRLKSSFPELGRAFGNRDHTTVMSGVRRIETLRKKDPQVEAQIQAIEKRLESGR